MRGFKRTRKNKNNLLVRGPNWGLFLYQRVAWMMKAPMAAVGILAIGLQGIDIIRDHPAVLIDTSNFRSWLGQLPENSELEEHYNLQKWLRELENACKYKGKIATLQQNSLTTKPFGELALRHFALAPSAATASKKRPSKKRPSQKRASQTAAWKKRPSQTGPSKTRLSRKKT